MSQVVKIKLDSIIPNKSQPRLDFYDETIEGLAESIKENGLLQPVSVRKQGDKYELIAGERRYRACLLLGREYIEAIVYDKTDEESATLSLIENIQREGLNAVEQAMAMQRIMNTENITQVELAERLGYQQSTVANKLRLLKLPDYIKNALSRGTISERHARALLKVPKERLEEVFMTITNRDYTVAKTEEYIKSLLDKNTRSKGVSNNVQIGVNTIRQAYDMCRKSGIDADFQLTEYSDNMKITIKIKK
ncbi:MAG: ParB/RepB/Spo0J family partition protein [Erysipelotrichaceae bacterium]|nr:ParB/RepB/Spo0J family partition protein [Erysipelotrichaceae bacterium]